jgi:hypothetical protein
MSSFHVDGRVAVKLEYELAIRLGELILSCGTEDKQILALGHKLVNMDEDNENPPTRHFRPSITTDNNWEDQPGYKSASMQDKVMGAKRKFGWNAD